MAQKAVKAIELQDLDSATLLPTYQVINATGLPNPCFIVRIINGSNTAITISYDGTTDHDVVFAASILELTVPVNTSVTSSGALFAKGLRIYARGTAGIGSIAVAGYYQENH